MTVDQGLTMFDPIFDAKPGDTVRVKIPVGRLKDTIAQTLQMLHQIGMASHGEFNELTHELTVVRGPSTYNMKQMVQGMMALHEQE